MAKALAAVVLISWQAAACSDTAPLASPDKEVCLTRRDGMRYCIETYEASRHDATAASPGSDVKSPPRSFSGVLPWSMVSWDAAQGACAAKGRRLCEADEWIDACKGSVGDGGRKYTYGNVRTSTTCNVAGTRTATTGAFKHCHSLDGTFDQNGNLWEWTGNVRSVAAVRGGGFHSDLVHACTDTTSAFDPTSESEEVGFRCCRLL